MEVYVKTYTQIKNPDNLRYMKGATAGDIIIRPDGYFTKNKHHAGAGRMGVVLLIPGEFKWSDFYWTNREIDQMERGLLPRRHSKYFVDLPKLFPDAKMRDFFDHDKWIAPISIDKTPEDLFKSVEDRSPILSSYDLSGSFISGIIDIGPNSDQGADARDFYNFVLNCGDMDGDLTGDCDEAYNESNVDKIYITGFNDGGYDYTFQISGAGRHVGKYNESYFYMSYGGGNGNQIELYTNAGLTHFTIDGFQISVSTSNVYDQNMIYMYQTTNSTLVVKNVIINQATNGGSGNFHGIYLRSNSTSSRTENSAVNNVDGRGIEGQSPDYDKTINSVAYDCGTGFTLLGCTSCAAHTISGTEYDNCAGDYNAGEDSSPPGANDVDLSGVPAGNIWKGAGDGNFELEVDSPLIDEGDPANSTATDIAGTARSTPDIGVWEYVAVSGGNPWWYYQRNKMRRAA